MVNHNNKNNNVVNQRDMEGFILGRNGPCNSASAR